MARRKTDSGEPKIVRNWFSLQDERPCRAYRVEREERCFLGAYALNLIVAEAIGLGALLVVIFQTDFPLWQQEAIAVTTAITLPVRFFPFSHTLRMALDFQLHRDLGERQPRASDLGRRGQERTED